MDCAAPQLLNERVKRMRAAGGNDATVAELETELTAAKRKVKCSVCVDREKNTVLLTCHHMFCAECIEGRVATRNRKCPACGKLNEADSKFCQECGRKI